MNEVNRQSNTLHILALYVTFKRKGRKELLELRGGSDGEVLSSMWTRERRTKRNFLAFIGTFCGGLNPFRWEDLVDFKVFTNQTSFPNKGIYAWQKR